VTVSRSDYGIYMPVLRSIQDAPDLRLQLFASGMHLSPEFGYTVDVIERDGFEISARIETLLSSDTPEGVAKSVGLGVIGFAQVYARSRPDILMVLGDRSEMYAAAIAALPFKIPIAHIHGGELTEGAIDDAIRHAITKMSHLHLVSTDVYARRVVQMGEEPWRVTVSGAPGLDNLFGVRVLSQSELERQYGLEMGTPFLLITYHPVTLEYGQTERQIQWLLDALREIDVDLVFTYPNADAQGRLIIQKLEQFARSYPRARVFANLGTQGYLSMMKHATAMVGNSSSGIIEAASFELPVVNIGTRQKGRVRGDNVIDVGYTSQEIAVGIRRATSSEFRQRLVGMSNPYGDGHAARRIISRLREVRLDNRLVMKRFHDEIETK
jgi:UDP-hydrolysing UDP-N-acetyl-D-glucosamine 2-epimerase